MAPPLPVEQLSLTGLICRIDEVNRLKIAAIKPDEDETAILESEGPAKKAIAELIGEADKGLTSGERAKSKAFLEAQVKAIDPDSKGAAVRKGKLEELLKGVLASSPVDEPAHVTRARNASKRIDKEYAEIHKVYEKWEKGKGVSFKSVDELTTMKRSHDDLQKKSEAAKVFLEDEISRLTGSGAAPPKAPAKASSGGFQKAKASSKAPSMRGPPSAGGGGYPGGGGGFAALAEPGGSSYERHVAEMTGGAAKAPAPRRPPPRQEEEAAPILSFGCTAKAAAQHLGIKETEVRAAAESCQEIRQLVVQRSGNWKEVQDSSVAIEKDQKQKALQAEKQKQANKIARATEKAAPTIAQPMVGNPAATNRPPPGGGPASAPQPKPAPKPKGAPKTKTAPNKALSTGNRFGGFGDDDEDGGGWSQVAGRR